jgi:catechol 2,3-dioxygenase-like lactoylglutathione lyase family enzyme
MLHHVSLNVSDFAKGKEFYSKALAPLGYVLVREFAEWSVAGFGEPDKPDTWIHGREGGVKETTHLAYVATSKDMVQGFYDAAIAAGGTDNGKPGYRKEYTPSYYAAFVKDPDGHNIEVVFMDPNPTE